MNDGTGMAQYRRFSVGTAPGGSAADEHPEVAVVYDATTGQVGVELAGGNAA